MTRSEEERGPMLTWTDCPARTPEQQIIYAQLAILRRLDTARVAAASSAVLPRRDWPGNACN
jgi:hypothetical protein